MNKRQYTLMLMLAILAGFVGGAVGNRFFASWPVFAQKKPKPAKVIEAEEFRLVDMSGNVRAEIKLKGFAGISVKAPVMVFKENGRDRVILGLNLSGWPRLIFSDENGTPRLMLWLKGAGAGQNSPSLTMFGNHREERVCLALEGTGEPYLTLSDETGRSRATLGYTELETIRTGAVEKRPVSSLVLLDKEGKVIWGVP